ncbi:MAG: tRNA pseudouridine(38-40) synthase TruA [Candidatus Thermoplasmatota archaeon]|nr:tRNA pseudouridine(38-40) synthase TruA [Candidatus Thermoplasmatota archaeon]
MKHLAVKYAYLGEAFHGSQRQPDVRTVEGEVIRALHEIGAIEDADTSDFRSAGRTDRGVSALGNVSSFHSEMDPQKLFPALSAVARDVFPRGWAEVGPDFNPRKAKGRWYRYMLRYDGQVVSRMSEAARLFVGYHDFTNFAKIEEGKDPRRRVESVAIRLLNPNIVIDVTGESFLWNMVRRMASALSMVGLGECEMEDVRLALEGPPPVVFPPLPPQGLILMDVAYNFSFTPVKGGAEDRLREQLFELDTRTAVVKEILGGFKLEQQE